MRLAFMGTPPFAVPVLDALVVAGHDVVAVYTQPPRPAQRGKSVQKSAVQLRAEALGLEVRTPVNFREPDEREAFAALALDAAIVAAYGLILPQAILDAPARGCLNVHASLLPRWRGAAPIQRAILAGDAETGVTIMQMERGLDTGPMWRMARTPVAGKSAGSLTGELGEMGASLMVEVLRDLDTLTAQPQPEDGVTYAHKIEKAEARLDWTHTATDLERAVRAFDPAPGAWFEAHAERVKLLAAEIVDETGAPGDVLDDRLTIACGAGALRATRVQRAGKPAMATRDLLNGWPIAAGTRLA